MNKIYNGDCLEIMKQFADDCIDLTITSPPYNLGKRHHTGNNSYKPYAEHNDDMQESQYQQWQIDVLNEIHRITNDSGSLIYNHKNRIKNGVQITPYEWLMKTKWIIKQELVWFNGSQNFDKIRFYPMTERVYWLAKRSDTTLQNNINCHDLFTNERWKKVGTKDSHKRQFPEKFVSDMLECFPSANVIFDPFSGSGTTIKQAILYNKNYIGIEISKTYCDLIGERISDLAVF